MLHFSLCSGRTLWRWRGTRGTRMVKHFSHFFQLLVEKYFLENHNCSLSRQRRNLAYIGRSQLMLRLWPEVSWDITDRNIRYKVFNSCLGYCFSIIVIGHKNCSSTVLADCCCVTLMIASQSVAGTWELPESCNWTSPSCLWLCDFVTLCPGLLAACSSSLNLQTSWLTLVTHLVVLFWAKSCEGQATPSAIITLVITMMASHDDAWIAMWFDVQFVHRPSVS